MTVTAQLIVSDGNQRFASELTSQALCATAAKLTQNASQNGIFDLLSQHQDLAVRMAVAGMENLSNEAVGRLATDASQSVVRQLLQSKVARKRLSSSQVLAIAQRDPELGGAVADAVEDFSLDDDAVMTYLESHPDTHVRTKLAANPFTGNAVLRRLSNSDTDERVRELAMDMLA
jgi:hypothetical protein